MKKLAQHFQVSMLFPAKIAIMLHVPKKKLLDIFFINLQEDFVYLLKVLSNNISRESVL